MSETAKINIEGKEFELPVITGSEGEKAIDISKLRSMSGYITIDPGFKNTGATTSGITFLDGEKGILRHMIYILASIGFVSSCARRSPIYHLTYPCFLIREFLNPPF